MLVLIAGVLVLGEAASAAEVGGVLLVAAGVLLVRGVGGQARASDLGLALAIAACIAAYTLIDSRGIEYASPIVYQELSMILPAVGFLALALRRRGGRRSGARSGSLRSRQGFSHSAPTSSCSPPSTALLRRR